MNMNGLDSPKSNKLVQAAAMSATKPNHASLWTLKEVLQNVLIAIRSKKRMLSPTAARCFNIWLDLVTECLINDYHIHPTPQELAEVRLVSIGRVKQNLAEIYSAFNVCCEAELYMLLRIAYILLENGLNKDQVTRIVWTHIKGLA